MEKGTINVDKVAGTVFIAFEDYKHCVGVGEDGPDEVFADMELLEQGKEKIVAFQIMDIDSFHPLELDKYDYKLASEQKEIVRRAYFKAKNR